MENVRIKLLLVKLASLKKNNADCNYINDIVNDFNDIVKESSWFGSRWWDTHLFGLKGLPKEEKNIRVRMIKDLRQAYLDLRKYEDTLSSDSEEEILFAIKEIVGWGGTFINGFISDIKKLIENSPNKGQIENSMSGKKPSKKIETDPLFFNLTVSIIKDLPYLSGILEKFKNSQDPSEIEIAKQLKEYPDLIRSEGLEFFQKSKRKEDNSGSKIFALTAEAKRFLQMKPNESFEHYTTTRWPLPPELQPIGPLIKKPEQEESETKTAHNIVSRWLKRKLVERKKGSINRTRYHIIVLIKESGDLADHIIDVLGDSKSSLFEILNEVSRLNIKLIDMYMKLIVILNHFFLDQKIKRIEKTNIVGIINDIIKKLNEFVLPEFRKPIEEHVKTPEEIADDKADERAEERKEK